MNPINFYSFACKLNKFLQGLGYAIVTDGAHCRFYILNHVTQFKIDYDLKYIYYLGFNDYYGTNGHKVLDFLILSETEFFSPKSELTHQYHTNIALNELKDIAFNFVKIYKQIVCKEKIEKMNLDFV